MDSENDFTESAIQIIAYLTTGEAFAKAQVSCFRALFIKY